MLASAADEYQEIDKFDYMMTDIDAGITTCPTEFARKEPEGGARWIELKVLPPLGAVTARQIIRQGACEIGFLMMSTKRRGDVFKLRFQIAKVKRVVAAIEFAATIAPQRQPAELRPISVGQDGLQGETRGSGVRAAVGGRAASSSAAGAEAAPAREVPVQERDEIIDRPRGECELCDDPEGRVAKVKDVPAMSPFVERQLHRPAHWTRR